MKNIDRRNNIRHGPAETFDKTKNRKAIYFVLVYKSKSIPSVAIQRLQKTSTGPFLIYCQSLSLPIVSLLVLDIQILTNIEKKENGEYPSLCKNDN